MVIIYNLTHSMCCNERAERAMFTTHGDVVDAGCTCGVAKVAKRIAELEAEVERLRDQSPSTPAILRAIADDLEREDAQVIYPSELRRIARELE